MSKTTKLLLFVGVALALTFGVLIFERELGPQSASKKPVVTGPDTVQGAVNTTIPFATTSTSFGSVYVGTVPADIVTTSTFTLRAGNDSKNILVFAGSKQLATLWPANPSRRTAILGQIGSHLYVGQYFESYNGYNVYKSGAVAVAQVDMVNGSVKIFQGTSDEFITALQEHSHGYMVMALLDYNKHELRIRSSNGSLATVIPLPVTFTQFGDMYFSADGTKLAFSAAFGIPGAERSAAFITPVTKPQLDEAGETTKSDRYMHIVGWKGATALDMSEQPGPLLGGF